MKYAIRLPEALSPALLSTGLLSVAFLAAGCASTPRSDDAPTEVDVVSAVDASAPRADDEASAVATPPAPKPRRGMTVAGRRIWNDPAFRERLAKSYLSDTETEPKVTMDEVEQLEEIFELVGEERFDEAMKLLEKHGGPRSSAVFDFTRATIDLTLENLDEAVRGYEKAIEKWPNYRRAYQNLGWVHFTRGDFGPAVDALTEMVQLGGGTGQSYGMLGFAYLNTGNSLSAETALRTAILLDPESVEWKKGLAQSLFDQRRFGDAVALFDALIAQQPDSAELWLLQGKAYIGLGQPMRAAENFELAVSLGSASAEVLNLLGDIYVNERLYDLAAGSYAAALDVDDDGATPARAIRAARDLADRGALAATEGLAAKVEEHFADGLSDRERTEILRLRARIALARGATDDEAAILEEIVALDPLDGGALILLGKHGRRNGEVEKAALYFDRAAAIEEYEADAKVEHAQLLVEQTRYTEALPLLKRAQAIDPRENVQEYLEKVERFAQQSRK